MTEKNINSRELIEQNLDYVRRIVYGALGNTGPVDDMVQEVFVRIIRGYDTFRHESSFQTWVYRIALRVIYDYLKKQKNTPGTCAIHKGRTIENHEAADDVFLRRERDTAIRSAIEKLSPSLRTTIVLFFFEDFSPEQVAEVEGCTTATVYWRLHEAKKQLKTLLKEYL